MKLTSIYCLIFIFLCVTFSIKAQNGSPDSLFAAGAYREASIEYDRACFLAKTPEARTMAALGRVECLKYLGEYAKAIAQLGELPVALVHDSLAFRIRYEWALCAYLSGNFEEASSVIAQIKHFTVDSNRLSSIWLIDCLNNNYLRKFSEARQSALNYLSSQKLNPAKKDSLVRIIENTYDSQHLPKQKKEKKAALLSTLLPGLGQTYAGYAGEGLVNLTLCASALTFGVVCGFNGYYITGYIVGAGLLQKLYFGGLRRTAILVEKGNYQRMKKFNQKVRAVLLGTP